MKKSRRYCLKCKKATTFKFKKNLKNKLLRHSKCSECGGTKSLSVKHAKEAGLIKGGNRDEKRS